MKISKNKPVGEDKRRKPIVEKKVVQSLSNTTKISPDALDTSAVQSTFKKGGKVKKHYEDNPQDFMNQPIGDSYMKKGGRIKRDSGGPVQDPMDLMNKEIKKLEDMGLSRKEIERHMEKMYPDEYLQNLKKGGHVKRIKRKDGSGLSGEMIENLNELITPYEITQYNKKYFKEHPTETDAYKAKQEKEFQISNDRTTPMGERYKKGGMVRGHGKVMSHKIKHTKII